MPTRYDQPSGQLDDQTQFLGDDRFLGINMRLDPSQLPKGYASNAVNIRFRYGVAETRKGFVFPPWANHTTVGTQALDAPLTRVGSTVTFTTDGNHGLMTGSVVVISGATQPEYNGTFIVTVLNVTQFTYTITGTPTSPATGTPVLNTYATHPWGTVHGIGLFSDPFTFQEYLIIAADGGVFYTQPQNIPQAMTLPAGVTITGTVEFTQAFDVMIMHRGPDEDTLVLKRITQAWELVTQTTEGDGTHTIPNGTHSLFLQNRLFVPNDNDEIAVSDLNDYTRYVPILQEFKINQGSADKLVVVTKFNDTTIIALKEKSVYAISNVYGNLEAMQQDELQNQFGCAARKSVAHVGKDLWFLSELGVMSLTQTEQNELQSVVLPASDPIQPIIDRINWRYAHLAEAAYWDSKYYLAIPLDDAEIEGPELAPVGWVSNLGFYEVPTVVGATYRWEQGSGTNERLINGTQTLTASAKFVAQGTDVRVLGTPITVDGSLVRLTECINNAILVYDFLNGAWAGYDEAAGVSFSRFQRLKLGGRDRLLAVTGDGYVMLYEEDFEDQLPQPYVDVTPIEQAEVGIDLSVNGGTVVTTNGGLTNGPSTVGSMPGTLEQFQQNLWNDGGGDYGYDPGMAIVTWTAPNTQHVKIATGVRFYATDGVLPTVMLTGFGATDFYSFTTTVTQPVVATLTTRGFQAPDAALSDYQWLVADVQTWAPQQSIDVVTPGVNEIFAAVTDLTRDRSRYYQPNDAAPFSLDNANGDFLTPYRQDYSVLLGSGTGAAADFALHTTPGGVPFGEHQEARITERVNANGRAAQFTICNEDGRIRVMVVGLDANLDTFSAGTRA